MTGEALSSLDRLFRQGVVWRGGAVAGAEELLPSGFDGLDALLGGGWPRGALVELLSASGLGLSLLLPLLARLSREAHWLAWVDPPWHPHAAALAARGVEVSRLLRVKSANGRERLWAVEQLLRSGNCSVVMAWPGRIASAPVRRLQLAAETGSCLGVLFRPLEAADEPSMAALRLRLQGAEGALQVEVLKRRGGWSGGRVEVSCAG